MAFNLNTPTALLALSFIFSGCSSSSDSDTPPVSINPDSVSGEIVIASGRSAPAQTEALTNVGNAFSAEYTDVTIRYEFNSNDAYRETIKEQLTTNAPDIVDWSAGNAMEPLIADNLLDDISDIWNANNLSTKMSAATISMTRDGKQWGIPYTTYGWGVYYRKDIFENLGISEPSNWEEFQSIAQTLLSNNISPLTIGTKFQWPAAGIFDYLNLRINGYEVHNDLTAGKIKYTDERIKAVFETWKEMVDNDYFISGHENMSWQDAIQPLIDGDAGMYIIGNFLVSAYESNAVSSDNLGFFQFPEITADLPRAEEAPIDALFIARNANNKPAAQAFLSFISRPEIQEQWNKALTQIPLHIDAELSTSKLVVETAATVRSATALSQFFDRDAPATMAQPALAAFQEFMLDTTKLESILMRLDEVQNTAY